MSDWSVLSGDSHGDVTSTASSDGFTIVSQAERLTTKNASVTTWLAEQADAQFTTKNGQLQTNTPTPTQTTKSTTPANIGSGSEFSTTRLFAITIIKSAFQQSSGSSNTGYFSLDHHPSEWFLHMDVVRFSHTLPLRIRASIKNIFAKHGVIGLLHVILWANVYSAYHNESKFWKQVEVTAMEKLQKDLVYWVLVQDRTNRVKKDLERRMSWMNKDKSVFKGNEVYFSIKEGVFGWEYYENGTEFQARLLVAGISTTVEKL